MKIILATIIIVLTLSACTTYEYTKPNREICDYPNKNTCESKGCDWRILTDLITYGEKLPATCCPINYTGNISNYSDPCSWLIG